MYSKRGGAPSISGAHAHYAYNSTAHAYTRIPRRRALAIRMRYMYTHALYYYAHNAHAHRLLMGWATSNGYIPLMLSSEARCVIVSGFRAALGLDTYPLSNLIRQRCAERSKPG